MKYFNKATNIEEAKTLYKSLALLNHPDKGGDTLTMQEINAEFDEVFIFLKHAPQYKSTSTETSTEYKRSFYTQQGWEGERYDRNLRVKDITKIMRDYVKFVYPNFKFSISKSDYNSIHISMMEAPVNMFKSPEEVPTVDQWGRESDDYKKTIAQGCCQVNHYYIMDCVILTDYAKSVMSDIYKMVSSYNYDDSDSQTDYFDTNFYVNLSIGKWDTPLKIVQKTARISGKEDKTSKRIS